MRDLSASMKLVPRVLGIAAMLIAAHGVAQTPGNTGALVVLQGRQFRVVGTGCPVNLSASQRSLPQQVETGSLVPATPAQGLTITLSGRRAFHIASAEVVAHALAPKDRAVLTATSDDADVVRPFHLEAKDGGSFSSDLWMEGVTSIRWIEVKSITYSNGTVWHESETQRCSVRPNPFVLVSSAR